MNATNANLTHPAHAWMNDPAQVAIAKQMKEDFDWAMSHHDELERLYPGESIGVWQKKVIVHGMHEEELLRQAAAVGISKHQLVILEFPAFFESPH